MNYRHIYHAGNFADVIKHVIQIQLIRELQEKDKPFCYIDTHAGLGVYDLSAEQAGKTKEYEQGIERIIRAEKPPELIKHYLHLVHETNNELMKSQYASLRYYPGSPMIARKMLRPTDSMILCELHPEDYRDLSNLYARDRQVAVHHMDGYLGLKALLPPRERRGLILIDPPYESLDEFNHLARTLHTALKKFSTGVYAIWYPIKDRIKIDQFYKELRNHTNSDILSVELTIYPDLPNHLNGSGMAIINPPWKLKNHIDQFMPWLWNALSLNNQGKYHTQLVK